MKQLLFAIALTVCASAPAASAPATKQTANARHSEDQVRTQNEIALRMAPIHSMSELHAFVASNRSSLTALDVLSPANRRMFIDSITFNEKGITGFNYAPLEGLSATQVYKILSLFGVQFSANGKGGAGK